MPFNILAAAVGIVIALTTSQLTDVGALAPPGSNCTRIFLDLEHGCAMPGFELSCDENGYRANRPFFYHQEVLDISLEHGQARWLNNISSYCYNPTTGGMDDSNSTSASSMLLEGTVYRLSDAKNKFTVLGCRALAYIGDKDEVGSYMTGCAATCRGNNPSELIINGSCSGIGCCQTAIPRGLESYNVWFDPRFNTTEIHDKIPCSYAALVEASTSSAFNDTYGGQTPFAVDWAIGRFGEGTCDVAQQMPDSYACVSSNSECINSPNGPGYICNCTNGFQGNPYLQDPEHGCQDIDECLGPNNCEGICHNTIGSFICCPVKTKYDPTTMRCILIGYNPIQQKVNCRRSCGDIQVPFPFGLEEGCFARKLFQLNCTNATSSSLQFDDEYQVTYINISEGLVGIKYTSSYLQQAFKVSVSKEPELYIGSGESSSVQWAVANLTCQEAKQNSSGYACVSTNSTCLGVNSTYDYIGYRCKCMSGFQGNPYIPLGCKDIDECQILGMCKGICHNIIGSHYCTECPYKTEYDPTTMKCIATNGHNLLIGICACIFSCLTALLGTQVIIHRRSVRRQVLMRKRDEYFQQHGGQLLSDMMKIERDLAFALYKREDIEAATNNFDKNEIIGEGGQGTVYKGIMDNTLVAIKRCKVVDESRRMEFGQELLILCRVYHSNIVKLLGCCLLFEVPILVYEFVPNKTLHDLLHGQDRMCCVTLAARLRIAAESAEALHTCIH